MWAAIFPIQTLVVGAAGDIDPLYFVFNALILALGIALNHLGASSRVKRISRRARHFGAGRGLACV